MKELDDLLDQLLGGDDLRAESAALQLAGFGYEAEAKLASALKHKNADHRWWALRSLSNFKSSEARELILQSLNDSSTEVQQCALLALRIHANESAIPLLIKFIEHTDPLTAQLASDALVGCGQSATQPLLESFDELCLSGKIMACRTLAQIKDPRAISKFFKCLDHPSSMIVYWSEIGLEQLGIGMQFFLPDTA